MFKYAHHRISAVVLAAVAVYLIAAEACAQAPKPDPLEQALSLKPIQQGQVEYSTPTPDEMPRCKMEPIDEAGQKGIRVIDPNQLTLREFIFADGTKTICQWRYFRDGIEVYRDVDSNGNRRADNYRWYNTAGTRWGTDANEDGAIDAWTIISAEEVSAELVASLATGDQARFMRLLPTAAELRNLGVGEEKLKAIIEKVKVAPQNFTKNVQDKMLPENARWLQFSGVAPSTFPSGTNGSTQDIDYYENAVASVDIGGKETQLALGTFIRVGRTWRALDCPQPISADMPMTYVFRIIQQTVDRPPVDIAALDEIDQQLAEAKTVDQLAMLHKKRVDLLISFAEKASNAEERAQWIRGAADSISVAIQQGAYPDGMARLQSLFESMKENEADKNLEAYVKFRLMTSEYNVQTSLPGNKDWVRVHAKWLNDLEDFVTSYPDSPDTAEAIFQLAMEDENTGGGEKALQWYNEIITRFPNSANSVKAAGAKARLQSIGKPLPLTGQLLGGEAGKVVNIASPSLKGRVILVYFWGTWMQDHEKELMKFKELQAKNAGKLTIIGVSLDTDEERVKNYIKANNILWPQIFEPGGMDSRPANQLGIISVPTIFVIGKDGNVIDRNVPMAELDGMIENALK